jgi:hypothetical protein
MAALKIGRSTIHEFLKMTKEEYISPKLLKLVKERYQYFIVDEISMLEKDLWKRLCLKGRDRYHLSAIRL